MKKLLFITLFFISIASFGQVHFISNVVGENIITCLSTDIKPTVPANEADILFELNTAKIYYNNAGVWTCASCLTYAPTASPTFTGTVSGITSSMVGLGNVTNESKATMHTNAVFTGTFTVPNSTITNAMLAGSIDLPTKTTGILPFASNAGTAAATSATTGSMTVSMTTPIITITPTAACTFNASGGVTGQRITFVITTSGTSSFVMTFGANFKSTATLATGTTTAKIFTVSFICTNGVQWIETSRTTAQ